MSTYKLIQDIEAEDHILGPLSLRQFIFALVASFMFYLCFLVVTKHLPFLLIIFLPPALFFGFFALPFGRDQPTEVWALAKLRFWFKPRRRVWNQSGVKQIVTITVPKRIERALTNGLNQHEVESRLTALANTLDSRGWAVKNASTVAAMVNPYVIGDSTYNSDRLVEVNGSTTTQIVDDQLPAGADILDETSSPISQHFDEIINQSNRLHHQQLVQQMNSTTVPTPLPQQSTAPVASSKDDQWFMPHIEQNPVFTAPDIQAQEVSPEDQALGIQLKAQHQADQVYSNHMRTLQPLGSSPTSPVNTLLNTVDPVVPQTSESNFVANQQLTGGPDPAILNLANNNDFTVDTLAREAKRVKEDNSQNEVVISLH
jgi:hypothetical protein